MLTESIPRTSFTLNDLKECAKALDKCHDPCPKQIDIQANRKTLDYLLHQMPEPILVNDKPLTGFPLHINNKFPDGHLKIGGTIISIAMPEPKPPAFLPFPACMLLPIPI